MGNIYKPGDILCVLPMYSSYVDIGAHIVLYDESYSDVLYKYYSPISFLFDHLSFFSFNGSSLSISSVSFDESYDDEMNHLCSLGFVHRISLDMVGGLNCFMDLVIDSSSSFISYRFCDLRVGIEEVGSFMYLHEIIRLFKLYVRGHEISFDFSSYVSSVMGH